MSLIGHMCASHLFVFVSRRLTHLKILTWDGTGMVVLFERRSKSTFTLPPRLAIGLVRCAPDSSGPPGG